MSLNNFFLSQNIPGSNVLRFSYESSPCNVLVDEGTEISAAKSTIAETDKSASIRPKPAATSSTSASQSSPSSSSTLSTTSQSTGGKRTLTPTRLNKFKRNRRHIIDLNVHHPGNDKSDSFQTSTSSSSLSSTSTTSSTTPTNSIDFSLHASSTPFDINVPNLSSSISSSSPFTLSPLESNSNFVEFDNDGKIDEGESSDGGGFINRINGSSGVEEFLMTNTTGDIDSMLLLVGDENEVSFDAVTHATNNEFELSETNFGDANSELTTEYDGSVTEVFDESEDDGILQNDSPSLISYGHGDVNFVGLDKPVGVDTMYQNANEEIEIHTLDSNKKSKPNSDANDIDQFPYIDTHNPDRIRYEVHDINSINRNDLSHEAQSTKRILVNVSIATDDGSGTEKHAVYTLHVSVPAGPDYQPKTLNANSEGTLPNKHNSPIVDSSHVCPMEPPPVPPCLCNCDQFCRNFSGIEDDDRKTEEAIATTVSDTFDVSDTSTASDAFSSTTTDETVTEEEEEERSCLESKDIPTVLILEGERLSRFFRLRLNNRSSTNNYAV